MITDSLCPVAWTARRGSFVGLMTLYESNYVRLGWLVPDFASVVHEQVSNVPGDCPLTLRLAERSRYTTTLALTYLFDDPAGVVADPDLEIRIYHDARLAEVSRCARWHRHEALSSIRSNLGQQLGDRWLRNVMLNKWLDYCVERGHCFTGNNADQRSTANSASSANSD